MIAFKKTFTSLAVNSVPYGPSLLIILLKVPDGQTDRQTDGRTVRASYRDAKTHLKISPQFFSNWHSLHLQATLTASRTQKRSAILWAILTLVLLVSASSASAIPGEMTWNGKAIGQTIRRYGSYSHLSRLR